MTADIDGSQAHARKLAQDARGLLGALLMMGIILLVVGVFVYTLGHPHTTTDALNGPVEHGSTAGGLIGLLLLAGGQLLCFVSLVGFGVKMGVEAARH